MMEDAKKTKLEGGREREGWGMKVGVKRRSRRNKDREEKERITKKQGDRNDW